MTQKIRPVIEFVDVLVLINMLLILLSTSANINGCAFVLILLRLLIHMTLLEFWYEY